jgi:hypothetical protein
MEKILQQILEGQEELKEQFGSMRGQISDLQGQFRNMQGQFDNMQGQLAENTRFVFALSQDVARTATKEDITSLSAGIESLNSRLFKQETELILLKTAK